MLVRIATDLPGWASENMTPNTRSARRRLNQDCPHLARMLHFSAVRRGCPLHAAISRQARALPLGRTVSECTGVILATMWSFFGSTRFIHLAPAENHHGQPRFAALSRLSRTYGGFASFRKCLRRPSDPRFIRTKFLIPIAVAALLEGTKIAASFFSADF